ncbi:hypothetical protein [Pararhizobium qamdonense]|uniref:hypothetical protein n=1 Tax=Pararhizobium qamdonense TaxID=3031126 RepID=UPI0023E277E3|nr:hypothetical protein [Pararhizobium qamdonense]
MADEPQIEWDSVYAEPGHADRNIAERNRPDLKPVEERMNIVSNRVHQYDPGSDTNVRLESGLEWGAMLILMSQPNVKNIQAQYGRVHFMREGRWHWTYFDLRVEYHSGYIALFAVRHIERSAEVELELELIRNQVLHQHAHCANLLTEKEISKPAVYRAAQIMAARQVCNEGNNTLVLNALHAAGGHARVFDVLTQVDEIPLASAWNALWTLIDRRQVFHGHPKAKKTFLKRHSWIYTPEKPTHA